MGRALKVKALKRVKSGASERVKTILIVDDEKNLLAILKAALDSEKVRVQTAINLGDAFRVLKNENFDVVIADICMTGVRSREGFELVRFIRDTCPDTHIVNMTGYGTEEIEKQCYENGADFYFNKPLDLKILINHLNKQGVMVEMMN